MGNFVTAVSCTQQLVWAAPAMAGSPAAHAERLHLRCGPRSGSHCRRLVHGRVGLLDNRCIDAMQHPQQLTLAVKQPSHEQAPQSALLAPVTGLQRLFSTRLLPTLKLEA